MATASTQSSSLSSSSTSLSFQEHAKLFKSNGINLVDKQNDRRYRFLEESKNHRHSTIDDVRGIKELLTEFRSNHQKPYNSHKKRITNRKYRLGLQFSEWLREKPDDFEDNWYMLAVPKGIRCLCIASDNRTEIFSKNGGFLARILSRLPGGHFSKDHQNGLTILDCIWRKDEQTIYVLDVLSFGSLNFLNCECEFRFYWLKVKVEEQQLNNTDANNEYSFKSIPYFECSDQPLCERNCFSCPNLDGLLFYHKQSVYTQGSTPLVGWLLPVMVPEILGWTIEPECLIENRPEMYANAEQYMDYFDKELLKKKRKPKSNKGKRVEDSEMDEDFDGDSTKELMNEEEFLEKNGFRSDDVDGAM